MKLKQRPEDFQVEELTSVQAEGGPFAFYQLKKRGIGTPEAVQLICRCWNLEARRVSFGGLKDRHALTTQYLTIQHGPKRHLQRDHIGLRYLGQLAHAYSPRDLVGNRFRLVIRDLQEHQISEVVQIAQTLPSEGLANYFDDQRFGSVGADGRFIAQDLLAEDYEAALHRSLASPYAFDRAEQKREKALLRQGWGKWHELKSKLPRGASRSIVTYLADHPTDFRGAFGRLRDDLKSLYLSAFQSYIWNRTLALWIERNCLPDQRKTLELQLGTVPVPVRLDEARLRSFSELMIPLASARLHLSEIDAIAPYVTDALAEVGLRLEEMKLRHLRKPFFSRGDRPARFVPQHWRQQVSEDELNSRAEHKRFMIALNFELPPGSYATIVVKRLTGTT
jgi:tRNA pseudouridine13 synthase